MQQRVVPHLIEPTPVATVDGLVIRGEDTLVNPDRANGISVTYQKGRIIPITVAHLGGCKKYPATHRIWIPECCLVVEGTLKLSRGGSAITYRWKERTYPETQHRDYTCIGPPPPEKPTGGEEKKEDKQKESSDERGAMLRKPKSGDILALVEVRQGYKLRLFDPQSQEQVVEVNVKQSDEGKLLPFIIGGVAAAGGLLVKFHEQSEKEDSELSVIEGRHKLSPGEGLTVSEEGTSGGGIIGPVVVEHSRCPGEHLVALDSTVTDDAPGQPQRVRNFFVEKLGEVLNDEGEVVAQVVRFELSPEEIRGRNREVLLVDRKTGRVLARRKIGRILSTRLWYEMRPETGEPGTPAQVLIHAEGLCQFYQRYVEGGLPEGSHFVLDYSQGGGASGPRKVPAAPCTVVPFRRGTQDGLIRIKVVIPEGQAK
jgi:hypothetical protein